MTATKANTETQVRAQAKWVRMSARKGRVVAEHIRGRSVPEARAVLAFTQRAAFSSSEPPISPTMITASVFGSSLNSFRTSMCFRPLTGSPPMPTQLDCPRPSSVSWPTAS